MLSYDELRKKYKKDDGEKVIGPSKPTTTAAKQTAGPSTPKTAKTAEKSAVSSVSGGKNTPATNLFKGLNVSKPETKKLSGSALAPSVLAGATQSPKDSDVLKRARELAANKTMSYSEKKKQIDQMQKELGKVRDRNLLGAFLQKADARDTINQVTQMQNELSKQLKRTAFGAGFGQAAGLDIYNSMAKKAIQNDPAATAQMQKQEEARKELQERNPGAYKGGQVAGELTQAAILYGTAGAAVEKAALAKMAGGKELGRMGALGAKILANQAADTAVMTPLTIAAGVAEGKEGREISADVAKQQLMDLGFNIGMGAAGEGLKALKGMRGAAKAEKEARAAARSAERAAEAERLKNNQTQRKLIKGEDLPASLFDEYKNLTNSDWVDARLQEVHQKYKTDESITKEMMKLDARREELEEMLGISTPKVQRMQKQLKNNAIKKAKDILNLSGKEASAENTAMIGKAIREAGASGRISKETREEIFEYLFAKGSRSNKERIDKELRDRLRNMDLVIARQDASNIGDFNLWKKGTKGRIGKIRIANEGELGNVDRTYQGLVGEYEKIDPSLFPADITNPGEQLERMKAVADAQILGRIKNTDADSGVDRDGIRAEFEELMNHLEEETAKISRYNSDRADVQYRRMVQNGLPIDYESMTTADAKYLHDMQYQLQKEANRVRRTRNLTEMDETVLQKLLRGELDEGKARELANINANDLMDVYAAERPLFHVKRAVKGYKKHAYSKKYREIDAILEDMPMKNITGEGWKDAHPMLMGRETPERVIDMVAPKEVAAKLKSYIYDKIHDNERKRTIYINDFKDKLRDIHVSTKKNMTMQLGEGNTMQISESGIVQWLGEKEFRLKQLEGMKSQPTMEQMNEILQLRSEIKAAKDIITPAQEKRIYNAIEKLQQIYKNEVHGILNDKLIENGLNPIGYIEGYFPHMNFDDPTNLLGQFTQKLGFDFSYKELPMDIAGRTEKFRPNKRWSGNLLERKGTETDYDALRAFDLYIDNVSDIIYHTDDIRKLRAFEDAVRYKLSSDGVKEAVDKIRNDPDMDELEKIKLIEAEYEKVKNPTLQNFVNHIHLYADLLAGKKHSFDRILETNAFGRMAYKVFDEIENRVAANMVAGNLGSALTNFIPITQGMANMGLKSNMQGLKEALEYMAKGSMDELTEKSAFLATREGTELLYETGMRKFSNAVSSPMTFADKFSTQAVWRSRYYDNLKKGMAEDAAIKNADEYARKLFGGRSKGAMPTIFSSKVAKPLTMFQLEVNNQISYLLKDVPQEAQGHVLQVMNRYLGIMVGAYIFNDVYEKMTGRRSALDPLGIVNDAIGDFTGRKLRNTLDIVDDVVDGEGVQLTKETKELKPSQAVKNLKTDIGGNVPFIGGLVFDGGRIPLKSAIPDIPGAIGNVADYVDGEIGKERAVQEVYKDLSPALWYMGMPVAGGQVRKTVHGLNTMNQGGRYNVGKDGKELQFSVDQESPKDWMQAALFGNWATEGGKGYIERGNKNELTANRTEVQLEAQEKFGISAKDYVDIFKEINGAETRQGKLNALNKTKISEEAKEFLYQKNILSGDKQLEEYAVLRGHGMTFKDVSELQTKIRTMDDKYAGMMETTGYGPKKDEKRGSEMYEYIDGLSIGNELKAQLQKKYASSAIQLQEKYISVNDILSPTDYATLNDYIGTIKGNGKRYSRAWKVKAAIDTNVKGKSRAEMQRLYEAWDVSEKVW